MAILLAVLLAAAPSLRAVVYPDRAQVTRAQTATCGARGVSVIFDNLTPAADPASFRALSPDGAVMGVRSELRAASAAFTPEAQKLDDDLRKLQNEARALGDERSRAGQKSRVADQLLNVAVLLVGREMVQPAPEPISWEHAFAAALKARMSAASSNIDAGAKLRGVQRRIAELRRKQGELSSASQRQSYRAEVVLTCDQGEPVHVELSYIVGGASWTPTYEARADEKAGRVDLAMFATVKQATGEDWKNAIIVLSTAIPRSDATPPEVRTLRVGAAERKAEKKILVRRDEEQRHAEAGDAASGDGNEANLEAQSQGLSVQLKIKDPADLLGDGTPARLLVGAHELKATFAYRTVPKLLPYVFRVADLVNTAPFPLLAGSVDTFRRSGFIARVPLERTAEGQAFHLAFGLEEKLKVKRVVIDEVKQDAGLFGKNKRFRFNYRFDLESNLVKAETVELSDHLPVSELDDVKVEFEDSVTKGGQVRPEEGIITWKVEVPAAGKKSVNLAFHVEVPGSYDSGGL